MVHIGTAMVLDPIRDVSKASHRTVPCRHSVLVVRDDDQDNDIFDRICEFLDIGVARATSGDDLARILPELRPLAVIADVDGADQDGFHIMKVAAGYDRALPILLLDGNDQSLAGAIDAVREAWGLTRVAMVAGLTEVAALVDFICQAAQQGGMSRLMRV